MSDMRSFIKVEHSRWRCGAQKGYELFQPIAQRFHGDGR